MTQAAPKRAPRNAGVPSIISEDLTVRGTLISAGDMQVDGKIEGDIRADSLVIGDRAVIVGDVYAEEAMVRGRVEGSIRARKVQLCATCHVEGNILHEALSVEIGAFFEGNCRHSDNPLADAPDGNSDAKRAGAKASSGAASGRHADKGESGRHTDKGDKSPHAPPGAKSSGSASAHSSGSGSVTASGESLPLTPARD